jgi:predicted ribosome quality control (RQC) complex YloA/Tae2 family protein
MAIGLDSFGITFLARELNGLLRGVAVYGVTLGEDRVLTITLDGSKPLDLRFLLEPSLPLVCVTRRPGQPGPGGCAKASSSRRQKSAREQDFPQKDAPHVHRFEEHLVGGTITDVSQIDLDRLIMVTVRSHKSHLRRLYFELMPPFPNLFLTDGEDTIIEPLFKAGTRTRKRILVRGSSYSPPLGHDKIHPVDLIPEHLKILDWRGKADILSQKILGVSPFFSREIVQRGSKTGDILKVVRHFLETYRRARVAPHVFRVTPPISKTPPHTGLAWYRPSIDGISRLRRVESLNAAVAILLNEYRAVSKVERARAMLLRAIPRASRRWEKVAERTGTAATERAAAALYRKFGDLIVTNLPTIRKGSSRIRVPNLYSETQEMIEIPLEPRLSPHANAEVYFKKARKAERRAGLADERLEAARHHIGRLAGLLAEVSEPGVPLERLRQIGMLIHGAATARKPEETPTDEKSLKLGIKPRRYVVHDGWTVLVGRAAKENDILTHRYAAPSDLWFHARQAQGSHAILRRGKQKAEVPKQAILEAAAIAAYYSKARTSKHVPVSYTEKRYIKRARKGPPGQAVMLREKVVFVDPALPKQS